MSLCAHSSFVFKQKTAYDLRISDWSSDVCSSDLATDRGRRRGKGTLRRAILISAAAERAQQIGADIVGAPRRGRVEHSARMRRQVIGGMRRLRAEHIMIEPAAIGRAHV